jgi:peptidoglycan/xylan/chitin deacetylase (PgdA/CDA1 family)
VTARLLGLGGLGALGLAYYNGQVPKSQLYGKTIFRNRDAGKRIALTYDDGPNPAYTPELLELLARHAAHATFFQIGKWVEREPALAKEVRDAGHAVVNHTFNHPTLALCSTDRVKEELRLCHEASQAADIEYSTVDGASLMRCPWGRRRPGTLRAVKSAGYMPVQWSITGWDWAARKTADDIAGRCLKAREGDVILLHDGVHTEPRADRSKSVYATRQVLEQLGAEGYEFVTIPELVKPAS